MKNLVILFLIFMVYMSVNMPSLAYEDSNVIAQTYNRQGALALSHAQNATGSEKKYFLKEAKWFYQKSVKAYSNNFEGYIGLAKTFMYLGRYDKAYNNLMIAYNFDNNNPMVNYYIAENSFLNEKYFNALSYYKEAIKYGYQNHYDTNYKTALCYDKLGDVKQAMKYYNRCIEINPDASKPKEKLEEIENRNSKYKDYYQNY